MKLIAGFIKMAILGTVIPPGEDGPIAVDTFAFTRRLTVRHVNVLAAVLEKDIPSFSEKGTIKLPHRHVNAMVSVYEVPCSAISRPEQAIVYSCGTRSCLCKEWIFDFVRAVDEIFRAMPF